MYWSHKEKHLAYAPEKGVRYDGVYRIEKCCRKPGVQGYKVCRYLFVRCDNDPTPWTSDENGDRPRPLPTIKELKDATDEEKACWLWKIPPPECRKQTDRIDAGDGTKPRIVRRKTQIMSSPVLAANLIRVLCYNLRMKGVKEDEEIQTLLKLLHQYKVVEMKLLAQQRDLQVLFIPLRKMNLLHFRQKWHFEEPAHQSKKSKISLHGLSWSDVSKRIMV
ncbi:hypothetical protein L1987_43250 [Smallanthus sonchifolius]|uniref:Uncharacterized protein n=1 Tax=Smallanthus sonchifolius TaxID=185202 RepID=A0ACB9GM50_9ASTR|nr:hypothetical protein L1987_43250 [Smallanthus sonchifolius]